MCRVYKHSNVVHTFYVIIIDQCLNYVCGVEMQRSERVFFLKDYESPHLQVGHVGLAPITFYYLK